MSVNPLIQGRVVYCDGAAIRPWRLSLEDMHVHSGGVCFFWQSEANASYWMTVELTADEILEVYASIWACQLRDGTRVPGNFEDAVRAAVDAIMREEAEHGREGE